mmetsp:Transcript_8360/g.13194  ORF Transcript_8360/g.13194 Transcript_8360/m.13194 type:complete len:242 (+) Transcript_8360:115-840(+)
MMHQMALVTHPQVKKLAFLPSTVRNQIHENLKAKCRELKRQEKALNVNDGQSEDPSKRVAPSHLPPKKRLKSIMGSAISSVLGDSSDSETEKAGPVTENQTSSVSMDQQIREEVEREVSEYLKERRAPAGEGNDSINTDGVQWWNEHRQADKDEGKNPWCLRFPTIFAIFCMYVCNPGNSVDSESDFSVAGGLARDARRSRMDSQLFEMRLFIKMNYKKWLGFSFTSQDSHWARVEKHPAA